MIRSLFLLLLFPCLAYSQAIAIGYKYSPDEIAKARATLAQKNDAPAGISVGGSYTTVELENAKKIVRESQPKELKLEAGEFEVIEPSKEAKQPLQFQHLSSKAFCLWKVKAGETFGLTGKRRGEKQRTQHRFEAKPYEWAIIEAIPQDEKATETSGYVAINRNGKNTQTDPPEEIDRVLVVVGDEKQPPPVVPPVDDPLVKTFRNAASKDATAGKADKKWLLPLAGIFELASEDSLDGLSKISDLDSRLLAARKAAGIPEPDAQFPNLRDAIKQEIYRALNVSDTDGGVTLTPDTKRLAKVCFGKVSKALEVLGK